MNLIANFAVLASRRTIFDVPVCDLGWDDALVFINELASFPVGQTVISFVNAHNMLMTLRDGEYRDILLQNLVLPDGIGLNIASKIAHGAPFPANLNGTDFVPALLTYMENRRRVGLIGGRREVVEKAAANFRKHAPWHEFIVISDGYFDKENPTELIDELEHQDLDILIIGMGTPLQEKWAHHHIRADHARLVLTVGALFDFISEVVPRAPETVRMMRLEWAYRMLQEPARLWRRYVLGIPVFLFYVMQYRFNRRERILSQAGNDSSPLPAPQERGEAAH
ncbi:WecB/TagA/CpsF family glycosyltransferase protein [Rhizobium etli 8C-3]|uniref:Exopolysaccharide biosynthesis WecB/TagA/CpsF family protein n=2 Tax=Rhizobium TaxID=379 RepID=A0A4R3RMP4_9HYPH|nr:MULTISPECIES: WecB/TagA/CpsF family glycosyltransferase [Rhizobium]APO73583.1 WecB/TagA/CpsF family glycosyltransferase protein [Rhizobium etli 8C-3]TCU28074.1 exopolysaccharide biosynthesis WecB/TagA/CpsF family protein [Rhizobium azibense]TCU37128.1 exopolysaccharide biosynthesis WecB/TagA/CpsF family protein [Rhizobium azibense]